MRNHNKVMPGPVDKTGRKAMGMDGRHKRLALQQSGQRKISKGHHMLSADTRYRRVGGKIIGGQSKKKIKQRATRAKNIEAAEAASKAAIDADAVMAAAAEDSDMMVA